MASKLPWAVASLMMISLAVASISLAEHEYEITATIGDTTLNSATGAASLPIAGTYTHAATGGQITISNVGSGGATAQIAVSDTAVDEVKLINARITANNTSVTNFPITFKRRMTQGPNTPPPLYYKIYASGLFQQGLGSSINIGWFSKNPLSNGFLYLGSQPCTPPGIPTQYNCVIAPAGSSWPTPPDMTADRVPKVEVALKLANGKWLDFDSTVAQPRQIRLYTSGSPDVTPCPKKRRGRDCTDQPNPSLYLPYQLEAAKVIGKEP